MRGRREEQLRKPSRRQIQAMGHIAAQSNLICVPRHVVSEESPTVQNGGSARAYLADSSRRQRSA
jgi:hypothetical protein